MRLPCIVNDLRTMAQNCIYINQGIFSKKSLNTIRGFGYLFFLVSTHLPSFRGISEAKLTLLVGISVVKLAI
jgi:hypothetical protein